MGQVSMLLAMLLVTLLGYVKGQNYSAPYPGPSGYYNGNQSYQGGQPNGYHQNGYQPYGNGGNGGNGYQPNVNGGNGYQPNGNGGNGDNGYQPNGNGGNGYQPSYQLHPERCNSPPDDRRNYNCPAGYDDQGHVFYDSRAQKCVPCGCGCRNGYTTNEFDNLDQCQRSCVSQGPAPNPYNQNGPATAAPVYVPVPPSGPSVIYVPVPGSPPPSPPVIYVPVPGSPPPSPPVIYVPVPPPPPPTATLSPLCAGAVYRPYNCPYADSAYDQTTYYDPATNLCAYCLCGCQRNLSPTDPSLSPNRFQDMPTCENACTPYVFITTTTTTMSTTPNATSTVTPNYFGTANAQQSSKLAIATTSICAIAMAMK